MVHMPREHARQITIDEGQLVCLLMHTARMLETVPDNFYTDSFGEALVYALLDKWTNGKIPSDDHERAWEELLRSYQWAIYEAQIFAMPPAIES